MSEIEITKHKLTEICDHTISEIRRLRQYDEICMVHKYALRHKKYILWGPVIELETPKETRSRLLDTGYLPSGILRKNFDAAFKLKLACEVSINERVIVSIDDLSLLTLPGFTYAIASKFTSYIKEHNLTVTPE